MSVTDRTTGRRATRKSNKKASNIPTGTVTFLFTDIEGSTLMWENHPDEMQESLARHDEILRAAVEARGGYVFKMVGDACCAAFTTAREALEATLAAQRALFAEAWEKNTPIRVRMALHTGVAEERDGDYFGPPVNRVARLLSAGHGGQVLLSSVTYGLVRDVLSHMEPEADLPYLGEHRLRDLRYNERIYQLVVPDLPKEFPPLRTHGIVDPVPTTDHPEATPPATGTPAKDKTLGEGALEAGSIGQERPPGERAVESGERYEREQLLGSGGMAEVYLARDELLGREVAMKILRSQYSSDEQFVERFKREAKNAASLSHPNIVAVHDRGQTAQGDYYIVMEYLSGGTLEEKIRKEGALSGDEAARIALQVACALEAAHRRGVIHRDIKPQNVMLTDSSEAKVADFGIARAATSTSMTKTGSVLGTAHYISPEQALGQPASEKSDLYSLGVVLYEMLTGELPYDAETPMGIAMKHVEGQLRAPKEVNPGAPGALNAVAVRLLARDPQQRYGSATEVVEDLQRLLREGDLEKDDLEGIPGGGRGPGLPVGPGGPGGPSGPGGGAAPATGGRPPQPGAAGGKRLALVLGIAGLLGLLLVVGLGVVAWLVVPNLLGGETAEVPSLKGQELAAARQEVGEDFKLSSAQRESEEPKGTIISQDPKAGTELQQGEEISVVVSSGPETITVPDVVGKSRDEAEKVLSSEGFAVKAETRESSEEDAGKVIEQTPSGGETEKDSEVAITVGEGPPEQAKKPEQDSGPAPGYALVEDPSGSLSLEVPSAWSDRLIGASSEEGNSWSAFAGTSIDSSITASTSIEEWSTVAQAPGIYAVASRELAQGYTDDELLSSGPNVIYADNCEAGPIEDFANPPYSGRIQAFGPCAGGQSDYTYFLLAATPENRECVAVVQVGVAGGGRAETAAQILDSLAVDCGGI